MPPEIVTGVNAAASALLVSTLLAMAWVDASGALTVRLNDALAVAPELSVAVIVKVVAVKTTNDAPLISPVDAFSVKFEGSAGLLVKV